MDCLMAAPASFYIWGRFVTPFVLVVLVCRQYMHVEVILCRTVWKSARILRSSGRCILKKMRGWMLIMSVLNPMLSIVRYSLSVLSSVRGILRTRKAMGLVYLSMRVQRALTRLETARNGAEMALV